MRIFVPRNSNCKLVTVHTSCIDAFIESNTDRSVVWSSSPDDADLIIVFEEWGSRFWEYADTLIREPLVSRYWEKIFTVNCDDLGRGFLPGLYTSLNKNNFDRNIHRACAYPYEYNQYIEAQYRNYCDAEESLAPKTRKWLFSFTGNDSSNPIRKKIYEIYKSEPESKISIVDSRFHSHTDHQKQLYIRDILDSQFALCPAGWSPSTYRLFEVMQLGRCPVIISDQWVPIEGINWSECAIFVRESQLHQISEILHEKASEAFSFGERARGLWGQHFSGKNKFRKMLDSILEIREGWCDGTPDYRKKWKSWGFYASNNWLIHQRVLEKSRGAVRAMEERMQALLNLK
jgi:hypothetical protein